MPAAHVLVAWRPGQRLVCVAETKVASSVGGQSVGLLPRGTVVEPLEKVVTADGVSFAVNLRRQEGRKQAVKGFVQQHTRSGGGGVEDVLLVEAIFDDTAATAPPPSSPAVRAQILRQVAAAVCEHALRGRLGDWLDALLCIDAADA